MFVDDVQQVWQRAQSAGLDIVHPLTEELWRVTRFVYRASDGRVIHVGSHTS